MTLSEKLKQKGLGGVAQVVECLTNKLKSLSSNSSTEKKKAQPSWREVSNRDQRASRVTQMVERLPNKPRP
jgi:hypothetical protein